MSHITNFIRRVFHNCFIVACRGGGNGDGAFFQGGYDARSAYHGRQPVLETVTYVDCKTVIEGASGCTTRVATGYSSGESCKSPEANNLKAYIQPISGSESRQRQSEKHIQCHIVLFYFVIGSSPVCSLKG